MANDEIGDTGEIIEGETVIGAEAPGVLNLAGEWGVEVSDPEYVEGFLYGMQRSAEAIALKRSKEGYPTRPENISHRPVLTLADAANACNLSARTMGRKLKRGEIEGAEFDEAKGQWRIPIEGLIAAGLSPFRYQQPAEHVAEPDETSKIKERLDEALVRVAVAEARATDLERMASNLERSITNFETTQKALLENQKARDERIESEIAARVELEVMKALAAAEAARVELEAASKPGSGGVDKPKKRWGRKG